LSQLSQKAEESDLFLLPPQSITLSALPSLLCTPEHPLSEDVQQLLAWAQALATSPEEVVASLLVEQRPPSSLQQWLPLAKKLQETWTEIGSCGVRLGNIAEYLVENSQGVEAKRWEALQSIFDSYCDILNQQCLSDPNNEFLKALEKNTTHCEQKIYTIGMPDIPQLHQNMLASTEAEITALIYAPEELSTSFDSLGCLNSESWGDHQLSVRDEALHFTHSTIEQATVMRHLLAQNIEQEEVPAVSIVSLNSNLLPSITRTLAQDDVALRSPIGTPLLETPPCVFLSQLAELLRENSFAALATIARNPCLGAWRLSNARSSGDDAEIALVSLFDEVYNSHLPTDFAKIDSLRAVFAGDQDKLEKVAKLSASLKKLFSAFLVEDSLQDLNHWCESTATLLNSLYPESSDLQHAHAAPLGELFSLLTSLRVFADSDVRLSARDFFSVLLAACAKRAIAEEPNARGIDLEGWLDILVSDCTHTCVMGFNEENIPQNVTPSPFLNEKLRSHFNAMDSKKRFARDSYLLHAALQSKTEIAIMASRFNDAGESLLLSRLLLQEPRDVLLERLQRFFSAESLEAPQAKDKAIELHYKPPRFIKRDNSASSIALSPTQLRDYLECPFRYYLKHILRLERVDDSAQELDQRLFGSLAHSVFQEFAQDPLCNSTDPKEIALFLSNLLDKISALQFGLSPRASIKIQLEQLRVRLSAFAHWQASHRKKGWRIVNTEHRFSSDTIISPQGVNLRGVIDRIDRNDKDRSYLVLDYKTGDTSKNSETAHRKRDGSWINLQLPLYLLHAREMLNSKEVSSGYINLGADVDISNAEKKMLSMASWSDEDLEDARAEASRIASCICQQTFWPPSAKPPRYDSFAELFPLNEEWFANA
jgi:hypothetical protein